MTEDEIRSQLVWRFTIAQRPLGRWRLNTYVLWKRSAWKAVVGSTLFVKRGFDILVSFIMLLLLSPIFLVAAALVKMDGGPAFLTQIRVGKHGREFKMYKFRSMVVNADKIFEQL